MKGARGGVSGLDQRDGEVRFHGRCACVLRERPSE